MGRGPRNGSLGSVQHPGILMCRWVRGWGFGVPFHAQWGSALLEQLGLAFSSTSSSVRNGEGQLWVFPVFQWALGSYREDLCTHSTFLFSEEAGSGEPSSQSLRPLPLGLLPPTRPWPPGPRCDCPPSDPGLSCPSKSEPPLLPLASCPSGWVLGHPGCCGPAG